MRRISFVFMALFLAILLAGCAGVTQHAVKKTESAYPFCQDWRQCADPAAGLPQVTLAGPRRITDFTVKSERSNFLRVDFEFDKTPREFYVFVVINGRTLDKLILSVGHDKALRQMGGSAVMVEREGYGSNNYTLTIFLPGLQEEKNYVYFGYTSPKTGYPCEWMIPIRRGGPCLDYSMGMCPKYGDDTYLAEISRQ